MRVVILRGRVSIGLFFLYIFISLLISFTFSLFSSQLANSHPYPPLATTTENKFKKKKKLATTNHNPLATKSTQQLATQPQPPPLSPLPLSPPPTTSNPNHQNHSQITNLKPNHNPKPTTTSPPLAGKRKGKKEKEKVREKKTPTTIEAAQKHQQKSDQVTKALP